MHALKADFLLSLGYFYSWGLKQLLNQNVNGHPGCTVPVYELYILQLQWYPLLGRVHISQVYKVCLSKLVTNEGRQVHDLCHPYPNTKLTPTLKELSVVKELTYHMFVGWAWRCIKIEPPID